VEAISEWLVNCIEGVGYIGIFVAMFLGNVLVPIPVELIMIPAGYLVQQGNMNLFVLLSFAIAGDVCGSLFSYYIAFHFGRFVILKYAKYLFFNQERMEKLEHFFASHGEISIITGRLTPGLRHFMAFPAGLSHMNAKRFAVYTGVGGGIWMGVLIFVGHIIGGNKALIRHYLPYLSGAAFMLVFLMILFYIMHHNKKKKLS